MAEENNHATPQLIEIGGSVYNRDHIVKVDLRHPGHVAIHTTLGIDEFHGEVASNIARFFNPPENRPETPKGKKRT